MTWFLALLPLYITGNLHCFGMCGPLMMTLAKHPFRNYYLWGRLASYSLVGGLSGFFGLLVLGNGFPLLSLILGSFLILLAISQFYPINFEIFRIDKLFLTFYKRHGAPPLFILGFISVLIPCGQTLIVFATLALSESFWVGLLNGAAFALFTSPSLMFAMRAQNWLSLSSATPKWIAFFTALLAGLISILHGLAELNVINHFVLSNRFHIILW